MANHTYSFMPPSYRAQPTNVVDGDTADLFVDTGFRGYHLLRFRFLDIDTPELNSKDADVRRQAQDAKQLVADLLNNFERTSKLDLSYWPLRIETAKDPDNFGRWLARIFLTTDAGEISVNAELLDRGLAVPYKK
jgi:endonuclease YncB( thermonuclease family)